MPINRLLTQPLLGVTVSESDTDASVTSGHPFLLDSNANRLSGDYSDVEMKGGLQLESVPESEMEEYV